MATLLIRNVDPGLHARLKARAAAHHRSLEEEARSLLRTGLARTEAKPPLDLVELATRLFGPDNNINDLEFPPRDRSPGRTPPDFSDNDA